MFIINVTYPKRIGIILATLFITFNYKMMINNLNINKMYFSE